MCRTCGPCIWEPGTSYELDEIKLILASRVSPAKSGETIERRMLSNIHLAKKTNYANAMVGTGQSFRDQQNCLIKRLSYYPGSPV